MSRGLNEDEPQQRGPIRELYSKLPYGSPLIDTSSLKPLLIEDDTEKELAK
jgi:hypothetical protein